MNSDSSKRKSIRFKSTSPGKARSRKKTENQAPSPAADASDPQREAPAGARDIYVRIRERAYDLFQSCGCQHGHDLDHWLEAERQVTRSESAARPGETDDANTSM